MNYPKLIIWWLFFLFNGFIISGDSNLRNCKRVWGMSNTINNIPMYSTGLYMCVETPEGNVLALPDSSTSNNEIKNVINTIKNISNSSTSNKFLSNSSLPNFFNTTNKTFTIQNFTNNTNSLNNLSIIDLSASPSPSSSSWFSPTPVPSIVPSPSSSTTTTTTPSTTPTATPSTTTTTPSSTITPSSTTPNPIEAPSPTHNNPIIDNNNNIPTQVLNETNKNYKEDLNDIEKEQMNPLLPTVIILSSIVGFCILSGIGFFIYKRGCCKGKKCSKTLPESEAEKVQDLESGEKNDKKGRNSWTVMTTTLNARRKLKQLEIYKNKKGIKPKLKSPTKSQKEKQKNQSVKVQKYPNKPPGMGGIRHQETKKRDNRIIRAHMEEQASRIPGGLNNPSLQRMMKRFPKSPRQQKLDSMDLNMSAEQQGWYKDQFKDELTSMVDKQPYTPPALPPGNPPPPPPEAARRQVEDIQRVVYGSKKNDNSPKMIVREIKPGGK